MDRKRCTLEARTPPSTYVNVRPPRPPRLLHYRAENIITRSVADTRRLGRLHTRKPAPKMEAMDAGINPNRHG